MSGATLNVASSKNRLRRAIACTFALVATQTSAFADDDAANFWSGTKPIIDVRVREEKVEQTGTSNDANAVTARARLGFETGKLLQTSLLAEGEFVRALDDNYNDTIASHGHATYAVVADPEISELNRLQLTNTSIPKTAITIGRQRINLDDQRFIGNVGWRQNEQTFDAARIVNKGIANLTVDVGYLKKINRVFGEDSPQGAYDSHSYFANIGYQTPAGKLTGFSYQLKFDPIATVPAAVRDSSSTYGLRFAGEQPISAVKLAYVASYARQSEYGDNPITFDNDYYLGELTLIYRVLSAGVGVEVLQGDGTKGFTTPLATLHKFQGWADKFLTTPPNGIDDRYANVGLTFKKVGPLDITAAAIYHEFDAEHISSHYGNEIDLLLQAKWNRFTALVKYADYKADAFLTDTKKFWAQLEFVW